jgi:hypothetical protein
VAFWASVPRLVLCRIATLNALLKPTEMHSLFESKRLCLQHYGFESPVPVPAALWLWEHKVVFLLLLEAGAWAKYFRNHCLPNICYLNTYHNTCRKAAKMLTSLSGVEVEVAALDGTHISLYRSPMLMSTMLRFLADKVPLWLNFAIPPVILGDEVVTCRTYF